MGIVVKSDVARASFSRARATLRRARTGEEHGLDPLWDLNRRDLLLVVDVGVVLDVAHRAERARPRPAPGRLRAHRSPRRARFDFETRSPDLAGRIRRAEPSASARASRHAARPRPDLLRGADRGPSRPRGRLEGVHEGGRATTARGRVRVQRGLLREPRGRDRGAARGHERADRASARGRVQRGERERRAQRRGLRERVRRRRRPARDRAARVQVGGNSAPRRR